MKEKRASRKKEYTIATIVLVICSIWLLYDFINISSEAKYLKQNCDATTIGIVGLASSGKWRSQHICAKYVVDNVIYEALGMDHGEGWKSEVIVHYNSSNPRESYCGREPVRYGGIEYAMLIMVVGGALYMLYELLIKKKY